MAKLIAMIVALAAGYLPHLLLGGRLSTFMDFLLGSLVGGAAYVFVIYKLKQMWGDL